MPPTSDGRMWLCSTCNASVKDTDATWRVCKCLPPRGDLVTAQCAACSEKKEKTP